MARPASRPDHVARLVRAYYHADPQVIDESSESTEDGIWRYRDPRMQRVADAFVRRTSAGSTFCRYHPRGCSLHSGHDQG